VVPDLAHLHQFGRLIRADQARAGTRRLIAADTGGDKREQAKSEGVDD